MLGHVIGFLVHFIILAFAMLVLELGGFCMGTPEETLLSRNLSSTPPMCLTGENGPKLVRSGAACC